MHNAARLDLHSFLLFFLSHSLAHTKHTCTYTRALSLFCRKALAFMNDEPEGTRYRFVNGGRLVDSSLPGAVDGTVAVKKNF